MSVAVHKLLLDIYSHEYLDTIPLPLRIEGRFWLERTTGKGKIRFLEVIQNKGEYTLLDESDPNTNGSKSKILLKAGHTHEIRCQGEHILLIVRKYQKDVFVFLPYQSIDSNIEIGRSSGQTIRFENPHISKHHAQLQRVQGTWEIKDCSSVNGVYVNRMRITIQKLKIGDHIDFLGLKIIIAPNYLMINHSKDPLVHIALQSYSPVSENLLSMSTHKPYHQSPYTCSIAEPETLELESPSSLPMKETMPLLYLLGPSITMGMSSISMAVFSLGTALSGKQDILQVVPTMLMAISMALGTILWPILGKRYESRQQKKEQCKQIQRYDEYLVEVNQKIKKFIQREEKYLLESYPDMDILSDRIIRKKQLWNHKKEDSSYLCLGIGKGNRKASFILTWEKENLSWKDNNLYQKLKKTAMTPYMLHDVPCIVDLQNSTWLGLVGKPVDCQELMLQLLLQLTAVHSYRTMHVMIVTRKEELSDYGCYYLPHLFSTDQSIRYLIHDVHDFKRICHSFHQQEEHEKIPMVIFHFDSSLHLPYPKNWMEEESCILIQHAQIPEDLYHQCQKILYIGTHTLKDDEILYQYAKMDPGHMNTCFHQLSGLYIKEESISNCRELSFLDLYQCNRIEDLKILDRWAKADCIHTLEAAIGILGDGELLFLDAHEQCHGPHGLLAGMTGSGKSETILTYILSLAITYPPADVVFLLIDYKGGAMAETFQKLPHVAGIITNLEQESVQRYLAAIESELKRRQQLFRQTSVTYDRSSMDIEKYRSLCLEHEELRKLPHLFIIADEFAELKSLQPDFLECLKQSARIGRSLGIHVILATQKPAGIVDDQIWSNSRFHICLKVQERSDSMEMLKREDAAYLKHAGECYFQVGNNELFERGLCAWTQAPYLPQDEYEPHQHKELELIDATAQRIRVHPFPQSKKATQTQLEALLQYLHQLVQPNDFALSLWKNAITGSLSIQTLMKEYGYQKGMYALGDDIHHQRQYPLTYPLAELQHTAVYGMANSGKTELLMTLLYSWIQESDEQTSIVLLDFEKCGCSELKAASCFCDVLQSEDQEKITSLFYQLKEQVSLRKNGKISWPFLLVIHNFEIFSEEYAEQLAILHYLMREGEKVQIYIVLTATCPGNLSYRITQYIHKTISLQLKDASDYRLLFSDREGLCPGKEKGCGMVIEKELLLFKTAFYPLEEQQKILAKHSEENCFRIPVLPKHIVEEAAHKESELFLGLDVISKEPVYLSLHESHWTFVTGAYKVYPPFVNAILYALQHQSIPILICSASGIESIEKLQQSCMSFLQEENGIILWQGFYQLRQQLDPSLIDRLLNSTMHHIMIEDIQQLQQYTSFEWFSHSLMEAVVIWSGKGFQDYQYAIKRSSIDHMDIKEENQAFIWKEDLCIELQVWEREKNG